MLIFFLVSPSLSLNYVLLNTVGLIAINFKTQPSPLGFGLRSDEDVVSAWAHEIYPCCLNYVFKSFIVEV